MKKRAIIEKEIGETPLQAIQKWKAQHPAYADVPASYAGRLDPMASGKLLILFGEECKREKKYRGLDKEYEIEVLLDLETDTGDVLGLASYKGMDTHTDAQRINKALEKEKGTHTIPYPIFSSKTVNGKPLFLYALSGTLSDITIPTHEERIYQIALQKFERMSGEEIAKRIAVLLARTPCTNEPSKELGANFRIDAVQKKWNEIFASMPNRKFQLLHLTVVCGSGAYMRTLAGRIGTSLGTSALALSIKRTRIGTYIPLWKRFGLFKSLFSFRVL
ncbi:MAG: hypothetical protein WAV21_01200 [Minisyncoccia bacterium]